MVTFLAGGTGTPKLLDGADGVFARDDVRVVGNTGDDVELGGLLVCPDLDTVLFHGGGVLDRETWWGIADDSHATNDELFALADAADLDGGPRYLPREAQTAGRDIARWRRFSGVAEFMTIGDRDRAVHITRTSLLDEGQTLTEVTRTLADAFGLDVDLLPMSDDPVATIVHTEEGEMHFQEYWVARRAAPAVEDVEFRGADEAVPTDETLAALSRPVVVGPSNPVTSIGPIRALPDVDEALAETPVVAVSPFVEDTVFSGPAGELMAGTGRDPSTRGVADAYPFADAFVLDTEDGTDLNRPVVRTDTRVDDADDANRVCRACAVALAAVGADIGESLSVDVCALETDDLDLSALPDWQAVATDTSGTDADSHADAGTDAHDAEGV
jgi:LPPG:FO 2-phospho-L-lactate transferase